MHMAHSDVEVYFSVGVHSQAGRLSKPTILLADDHPNFPDMVERLLYPNFEVVGKVADGQALFEAALKLQPDVIVTDISMPILDGIEAAVRLKECGCRSRIVFLSVHSDPDFVRACLATGAFGYVMKANLAHDLLPAIHEALAGNLYITRHLTPGNQE
jgi:DNA-binding NarL/FixJ family response regulator